MLPLFASRGCRLGRGTTCIGSFTFEGALGSRLKYRSFSSGFVRQFGFLFNCIFARGLGGWLDVLVFASFWLTQVSFSFLQARASHTLIRILSPFFWTRDHFWWLLRTLQPWLYDPALSSPIFLKFFFEFLHSFLTFPALVTLFLSVDLPCLLLTLPPFSLVWNHSAASKWIPFLFSLDLSYGLMT